MECRRLCSMAAIDDTIADAPYCVVARTFSSLADASDQHWAIESTYFLTVELERHLVSLAMAARPIDNESLKTSLGLTSVSPLSMVLVDLSYL